jgi:hypothetical protein
MAEKCEGREIGFKFTIRLLKLDLSFAGDNSQVDFRFNFRQLMLRRSLEVRGERAGSPNRFQHHIAC